MRLEVRKPTAQERALASSWPVWEKEVSTFPWRYAEKETCLILEGRVTVRTPKGETSLGPGDWVVFPEGLECTWIVEELVRKHYRFG